MVDYGYSAFVSRLENIIRRNQPGGRPRERVVVSMVFGAVILLIIFLMVFTDLGAPPPPDEPPITAPVDRPQGPHAKDVLLKRPRPVAPPAATAK